MIGSRALEARVSHYALGALEDELEAARDLISEIHRGYHNGTLEEYGLEPEWVSANWSRVRTDELELGRLLEWRYGLACLVLEMQRLRLRTEASALELEALTDPHHSHLMIGLELLEAHHHELSIEPPPLEERSVSISAHGPPVLSAPMRTGPSSMLT